MPKIGVARLNALRPKPKPSEQPAEPVRTPSDDGDDPMEEDRVSTGRTLRESSGFLYISHSKKLITATDCGFKKPQTISRRINDPGIIAACHCGDEYETEYSESIETHTATSIETHTATSIDIGNQKSTDIPHDESVDSNPDELENDYYNPTIDAYTRPYMHTDEYDEDFEEERAIENRAILDEEDKLLHHSSWKRNAPSFDMASLPSIDTQPQQRCRNWSDEPHHESFAVEIVTYTPGADKLQDSFTDKELLNMQKRDDTYQIQAEAAWERTRSIDTRHQQSIDKLPQQSIDINNTTSIDNHPIPNITVSKKDKLDNQYLTLDEFGIFRDPNGFAKAIDGRTLHVSREDIADILQTTNGADNMFMHQRSNREQKTTKEFYDADGGIENSFKQRSRNTTHPSINKDVPTVTRQPEFTRRAFDPYGNRKFYWQEKNEYGVYRDDREFARDLDGHTIPVHNKDIRRLLERASKDEPSYICLPEHASQFTQTNMVPEIHTKDEINEMFYGVFGEHDRNKEAFQMKLDGVYYPLNDSISWLTTCMEEMKQDIARIQNATDVARPPSIDRRRPQSIYFRQSPSLDIHHHASIDNRLAASILCLTLIDPKAHYDPIPVKKPQTISRRINDPGIIAACHCGDEYETEYSESIETHTATSIDSSNQISTDIPHEESVDTHLDEWENDYYNPTIDAYTRQNIHTNEYDKDYEEELAIEYGAILDEEDKLLHHSSWKRTAPLIDRTRLPSIDTQPQQRRRKEASTDTAYYKSIDTDFNRVRDGDYSIGSWADEHHHESFAVETVTYTPRAYKLQDSFTDEELLNMQKRDDTDQFQAEAAWERTRSSQSIDTRQQQSIDKRPQQSIDINNTTSIDNHSIPKTTLRKSSRRPHNTRISRTDIFQTANGADNLFMHQRSNREQKTTKEFYDTAGGIENSFKQLSRHTNHPSINIDVSTVTRQPEFSRRAFDPYGNKKFYWEDKDEYGVYRDDREFARDLDEHTIPVHNKDIRRLLERASRDEAAYICLPEHASQVTQTKLVPEIYTKDKINEMFYGVCCEHVRNKEAFQMKLDGVYYPLNDSISWLTTCMEEMKQDIARIQNATGTNRPQSIDIRQSPLLDIHHHTSIDNRLAASIDTNPPRPHKIKALETTEERLDGRCDYIYFPKDLTISALTSKVEAIQGGLVEIQSYIARRAEAPISIDRRINKSIDTNHSASIDIDTNRGRLVPKTTSDMFNTPYHGKEISADTYAALTINQFNLESLGERLQRIENTTAAMKDKWRRGEEAMRDFTDSTKDTKVDQPVNYPLLLRLF
ncbi:hypothetical protein DY000_02016043 [Brassica cretica]|uniref:Uncharacterized protein n=1 Tax=Brassica cretica TaxID=69181 RepID=A0ABQ7D512_BRACR|nr:hypothetical protein DY000_02016043 [Brassica cretica]